MTATAIVLTTINVPRVLEVYPSGSGTRFFVIGDRKSPEDQTRLFLHDLMKRGVDVRWYPAELQEKLGYACSDLIGWDSIQRRNIGFLEALKWGADVVISIDDDNVPISPQSYRLNHCYNRNNAVPRGLPSFTGPCVINRYVHGWFDPGQLLVPRAPHRGFPSRGINLFEYGHIVDARIGVNAGICLGDPDIGAVERIANAPMVHQVSELLRAGIALDCNTWTVFNSQNTAVIRELIPAWGMVPFVNRYDDIYASLICQRVMRDRGLHVHFGPPFVFQNRNAHDLIDDLRKEIDGMEHILDLSHALDQTVLPGKSVVEDCRIIWYALKTYDWMPARSVAATLAFLDDCERVLG
jgi:hypothetical protein